jgi:hypothetical protein
MLIDPMIGIRPIKPVTIARWNQSGVLVNQNRSSGPSTARDRQRVPSHHQRPSSEIRAGIDLIMDEIGEFLRRVNE